MASTVLGRRDLVKLLSASVALAGASCSRERVHKIMPYAVPPADTTPGIPRYYATSVELDGFATGLLVESHEGRPTKIEGNPAHPASLGATTAFDQALVLGLYDPDRARRLVRRGAPATWDTFLREFTKERADGGAGLRFLLEPTGSPLLEDMIGRISRKMPAARFTFYSPVRSGDILEGARIAFGEPVDSQHDLSKARVVLSLEADFLSSTPFSVRHAREFSASRRISAPGDPMSRLYVIESMLSPTGTRADHRLRAQPSEIGRIAASVAAELMLGLGLAPQGGAPPALSAALAPFRQADDARFVKALARDLARHAGASLVIAGERQPPVVHAIAHLMNALVSGAHLTWTTAPTLLTGGPAGQDLASLAREIEGGGVDTLVILGGNPAYTAPADIELSARIASVKSSIYLGLYENETAHASSWFVPMAHALETWGDARAYDGTISLIQPLINPLFGGRTPAELLAAFARESYPDTHALLRAAWQARVHVDDFNRFFQEALQAGLMAGTAAPAVVRGLRLDSIASALGDLERAPRQDSSALQAAFIPDSRVYDGRFANNPWLLELPDPITKLTWDNAALLSPGTAARLGVTNEDMLLLDLDGRKTEMPALIVPGHADGVVSLPLGYGRDGAEALARGVGVNVYRLRTSGAPFFAPRLSATKLPGRRYPLAVTQEVHAREGRPVALSTTLADLREHPDFAAHKRGPVSSLYPEDPSRTGRAVAFADQGRVEQWAMTIDTSICTGCNACVLACQAENNVLVVGKDDVLKNRQMHWLRIDTYYEGDLASPEVTHQPMLCQHCEKAPCEYVCPVNATVHSPDGLNEMVYNRCVGTRFCSNNCPYKVRRFNWFDWTEEERANQGLVKLQRNPDVTVRQRGVMEKCTYCVQRIRAAEITSQLERRPIREGEVVTACAQACPTQAIQFGSLSHEGSKMVAWRSEPRSYEELHELGTAPRTRYLADIKNPNPELL